MIRKVTNPFDPEKNPCFGCGPQNPFGLKLKFEETDNEVLTRWDPVEYFQGYFNVLHGGIIATLLDEVAAWYIQVKLGTSGVTSELKIRYIHPVHLSKGCVEVVASLVSRGDRTASLKCTLRDGESKICAEADALFFVYPEEVAKRRLMYPGIEAFREGDST
jgi:uncharacterized protein (TIGR00369 family)